MASANYATYYLVEMNGAMAGGSNFTICKSEAERDACISAMCREIADMQCVNSDRPKITIRVDRHVRPNGPLM